MNWPHLDPEFLAIVGAVSLITFLASLAAVPILVVRIPANYFLHREPPPSSWRGRNPALRLSIRIAKNLLGLALLAAGIAMLLLPGQGVLTILIGLTLIDFPGKRRFERWLVSRKQVARSIGWMRRRAGRPPLQLVRDEEGYGPSVTPSPQMPTTR